MKAKNATTFTTSNALVNKEEYGTLSSSKCVVHTDSAVLFVLLENRYNGVTIGKRNLESTNFLRSGFECAFLCAISFKVMRKLSFT